MRSYSLLLIATNLLVCFHASGALIRVPTNQPTIQQAIAAAADGDTVLVAPGVYNESISFQGKDIIVMSEAGPESTIIDSHRTNRVVTVSGNLGRTARLQGFTVRNGTGGILLNNASATIIGNIITSNTICGSGAGIDVEYGSPLIVSNIIAGNFQVNGCSGGTGGGIYVFFSGATTEIVHNVITNNSTPSDGGGIELWSAGTPIVRENVIGWNSGASGGGISMANYSDAFIANNIIVSNKATGGKGGGIYDLVPSGHRGPFIINNTVAYNFGTNASGIYSDGYDKNALLANNIIVAYSNQTALYIGSFNDPNQPIIRYNDLFSPSGLAFGGLGTNPVGINGNISASPLFLNPPLRDYRLQSNSPAIEAGLNSDAPTNDFDYVARPYDAHQNGTNRVDMGAYEWIPVRAKLCSPTINANHQPTFTWTSSGGCQVSRSVKQHEAKWSLRGHCTVRCGGDRFRIGGRLIHNDLYGYQRHRHPAPFLPP